jgi:hypothetical protein
MIQRFIEFNEEKEVDDKITDDKNEFIIKNIDKFIDQDIEIEKETTSKPAGKLPLISGQNFSKPIFNTITT